jgi:ribosomal protein L11
MDNNRQFTSILFIGVSSMQAFPKLMAKVSFVFLLMLALSACAVNRSTVAVDVPEATAGTKNGVSVKILEVTDNRVFEFRPGVPQVPSLSESEQNNKSVEARAIGRKRNGFGKALGDVLLPEDQTIAGLVEKTVTNAFLEAGFTVVKADDAAYGDAIPVKTGVVKFWSWIEWGFTQLPLHTISEIEIVAPIGELKEGMKVENEVVKSHFAVVESDWQKNMTAALAELQAKIVEKLKSLKLPESNTAQVKEPLKIKAGQSVLN